MKYLIQYKKLLAGAACAFFLTFVSNAHAGGPEELQRNCKKLGYNRVCTFVDDFDRECTVIYGSRGAGIDCQRKSSRQELLLL